MQIWGVSPPHRPVHGHARRQRWWPRQPAGDRRLGCGGPDAARTMLINSPGRWRRGQAQPLPNRARRTTRRAAGDRSSDVPHIGRQRPHGTCSRRPHDVTDVDQIRRLMAAALAAYGGCPGLGHPGEYGGWQLRATLNPCACAGRAPSVARLRSQRLARCAPASAPVWGSGRVRDAGHSWVEHSPLAPGLPAVCLRQAGR